FSIGTFAETYAKVALGLLIPENVNHVPGLDRTSKCEGLKARPIICSIFLIPISREAVSDSQRQLWDISSQVTRAAGPGFVTKSGELSG
ncbi:MAG: hypothetical protein QGD90_08800, partial [Candidatus Hydrogenedentes bacterium]|nr:hypothetical protein [Candidatus Hydrogenedentota bacterium]